MMSYKEKFILNYINSDVEYLKLSKESGYTIEKHLETIRFLYWDDLIYRLDIVIQNDLDLSFKLEEYAKFLIHVYKITLSTSEFSKEKIILLHRTEYQRHRQSNYENVNKLFFLI